MSSPFEKGDAVEVWSNSQNVWFVGSIEEVVAAGFGQMHTMPEGTVRVRFGKSLEKWILPVYFSRVLRRHVPRVLVSDSSAPPRCVLRLARRRYYAQEPGLQIAGTVWLAGPSANGRNMVSIAQLLELWVDAVAEETDNIVSESHRHIIHTKLRLVFSRMGRDQTEKVSVEEWLHHSLLLVYPPGCSVAATINTELKSRTNSISKLVDAWMDIDKESTGRVLCSELEQALRAAGKWEQEAKEATKQMTYNLDGDGFASTCYCDWAAHYLSLPYSEVNLTWYDLTRGWSSYISPLLLWRQEGGIWHTGLVAFGTEFYYSGRIYSGRPGTTPFGRPTKVQRLGLTMKTAEEFNTNLSKKWESEFTEVRYDVLEWNCNNFTDTAALFLLEQQIPEEIRLQPQRTMSAPVVRLLRPMLNQWLGKIDGDAVLAELDAVDAAEMPPLEAEGRHSLLRAKKLLGRDRVALYMPKGYKQPVNAQVQKQYPDGSCDIIWFEGSDDNSNKAFRVPASKLKYASEVQREEVAACTVS